MVAVQICCRPYCRNRKNRETKRARLCQARADFIVAEDDWKRVDLVLRLQIREIWAAACLCNNRIWVYKTISMIRERNCDREEEGENRENGVSGD